jgi:hypothetical protein
MASPIDIARIGDGCDRCAGRFHGDGSSEGFAGDYRSSSTGSMAELAIYRLRWNAEDGPSVGAKRYLGCYGHRASERGPRTGNADQSDAHRSTSSRAHLHRCTLLPAARRSDRTIEEEIDVDFVWKSNISWSALGGYSGCCASRFFLRTRGNHRTYLDPVSSRFFRVIKRLVGYFQN